MNATKSAFTRRDFARASLLGGTALAFPNIFPARVLGADAPSKKINVLQIGCGRIGRSMDLPGILNDERVRVIGVCDLDSVRVRDAQRFIAEFYARKNQPATVAM